MSKIHHITRSYDNIVDRIETLVKIKDVNYHGKSISVVAVWDTGAAGCVISKKAAEILGLLPIQKAFTKGINSIKIVDVYYLNIILDNDNIILDTKATEGIDLSTDDSIGILLGMDLISRGEFNISNVDGKTTFSFSVPADARQIDSPLSGSAG